MGLKERFQEVKERLAAEITALYGERLVSLVLFGSVAQGTPNFDSDMDLLIIAESLPPGRMKRIREFEAVEERIDSLLHSLGKKEIHTS